MVINLYSSLTSLASGIYEQNLSAPDSAAYDHLVNTMQQLITCQGSDEPLYLLQNASSLDLAYTPRIRAFVEMIVSRLHNSGKVIRLALLLPEAAGGCTDFINCLLRPRETARVRHMCFDSREAALAWLHTLHLRESQSSALDG